VAPFLAFVLCTAGHSDLGVLRVKSEFWECGVSFGSDGPNGPP